MHTINARYLVRINPDIIPLGQRITPLFNQPDDVPETETPSLQISCAGATQDIYLTLHFTASYPSLSSYVFKVNGQLVSDIQSLQALADFGIQVQQVGDDTENTYRMLNVDGLTKRVEIAHADSSGHWLTLHNPSDLAEAGQTNPTFGEVSGFKYQAYFCLAAQAGDITLAPFDFAIVRYIWTNTNGRDLDTRSSISVPPHHVSVGWNRHNTDMSYLRWGGDNRSSGVESVLINFLDLKANYSSLPEFQVELAAFWYNQRFDGNVTVQFETYRGGVMQSDDYDFMNIGGQTVDSLSIVKNIHLNQQGNIDGEPIGVLIFDTQQNTASFHIYPETV